MKHLFLLIAFICSFSLSMGQDFAKLAKYEFKTAESYKEQHSNVLACANYMFDHATDDGDVKRLVCIQYITKWMTGTPDYRFDIGAKAAELTNGDANILGLYLAAMTKTVLDNEDKKLTNDEIYQKSEKLLVDYCSDKKNNLKPSKKIKKLMKSK